ncbi:hypothetical protein SDC9_169590 [bioreactor metagenome]|uniref:Uncharacterized protein n=1 Tax=bioreactor metagenome TaxID=1076179 RepID=A0A645G5M0_9ZZZZ
MAELPLQRLPFGRAGFGKARRVNNHRAHAQPRAAFDQTHHLLHRHGQDGTVNARRQRLHIRKTWPPQQFRVLGIDRIDRPLELRQILQGAITKRANTAGGTHHRDHGRIHKTFHSCVVVRATLLQMHGFTCQS